MRNLPNDCEYFKPGDHFVMDRGFRDSINPLQEKGIITHMPELLSFTGDLTAMGKRKRQKQFTTEQGNKSRMVTLVRWLVEACNGRIKKKFRLMRDTVPGGELLSN
jgi:hypothetical protein